MRLCKACPENPPTSAVGSVNVSINRACNSVRSIPVVSFTGVFEKAPFFKTGDESNRRKETL